MGGGGGGGGGGVDMERKGYELVGCYAYVMTLSYDIDLEKVKYCISGIGGPIDMEP